MKVCDICREESSHVFNIDNGVEIIDLCDKHYGALMEHMQHLKDLAEVMPEEDAPPIPQVAKKRGRPPKVSKTIN